MVAKIVEGQFSFASKPIFATKLQAHVAVVLELDEIGMFLHCSKVKSCSFLVSFRKGSLNCSSQRILQKLPENVKRVGKMLQKLSGKKGWFHVVGWLPQK